MRSSALRTQRPWRRGDRRSPASPPSAPCRQAPRTRTLRWARWPLRSGTRFGPCSPGKCPQGRARVESKPGRGLTGGRSHPPPIKKPQSFPRRPPAGRVRAPLRSPLPTSHPGFEHRRRGVRGARGPHGRQGASSWSRGFCSRPPKPQRRPRVVDMRLPGIWGPRCSRRKQHPRAAGNPKGTGRSQGASHRAEVGPKLAPRHAQPGRGPPDGHAHGPAPPRVLLPGLPESLPSVLPELPRPRPW